MEKKLEIKKLADVVVWADNEIEELKDALYEEEFEDCDEAKDLEVVKKVVLEAINRHKTYTNDLNQDIADKAAKIDLLEKEIEGRKEGYTALKELMDTKYIPIDEHNRIVDQFKEEVKKLNKCIMNKNESINTGNEAIINLRKEIGAHEEENARLSERIKNFRTEIANERNANTLARDREEVYQEKIKELNSELTKWKDLANMNKGTICDQYEVCEEFKKKIAELEKENSDYAIRVNNLTEELERRKVEIEKLKVDLIHEREKNEKLAKDHAKLENDIRKYTTDIITQSKIICKLKKELDGTKETLDNTIKNWVPYECITHENKTIEDLKKAIKKLSDENKQLSIKAESLDRERDTSKYWETQYNYALKCHKESEREVEKLKKEIDKFTKGADGYVESGFKIYVKNTLTEAKGNKNEANEIITEAVRSAYAEWSKTQKEEETEVKGNGRTSSGRYPWGAKIIRCEKPDNFHCVYGYNCPVEAMEKCKFAKEWKSDIPCGSDSIE